VSREPDIDGRTPRRFLEPVEDSNNIEHNIDRLTTKDFDTSASRSSERSLMKPIQGNIDMNIFIKYNEIVKLVIQLSKIGNKYRYYIAKI